MPVEEGFSALIDSGNLPDTIEHFPVPDNYMEVKNALTGLLTADHEYRILVIDTFNSLVGLLVKHIVKAEFKGQKGAYLSYYKGEQYVVEEWRNLLALLDKLRLKKNMAVFLTGHSKVVSSEDPNEDSYKRWSLECESKGVRALTIGWVDSVLFMRHQLTTSEDDSGRKRGISTGKRILQTTWDAGSEAKNRFGFPGTIDLGSTQEEARKAFIAAMKTAKPQSKKD
jgi:hypothetical protein